MTSWPGAGWVSPPAGGVKLKTIKNADKAVMAINAVILVRRIGWSFFCDGWFGFGNETWAGRDFRILELPDQRVPGRTVKGADRKI